MAGLRELPWTNDEKNYILAEIIKAASPAPPTLIGVIHSLRVQQINWGDLPLPPGRSVNSCMRMFEELNRGRGPPIAPGSTFTATSASMPLKRPFPFDAQTAGGREIRPKPSLGSSSLGPPPAVEQQPEQPVRRKRGRPPKASQPRPDVQSTPSEPSPVSDVPQMRRGVASGAPSPALQMPGPSPPAQTATEERRPVATGMPIAAMLTPTAPKPASQSSSSSGKKRARARSTRSLPAPPQMAYPGDRRSPQQREYESPYAQIQATSADDPFASPTAPITTLPLSREEARSSSRQPQPPSTVPPLPAGPPPPPPPPPPSSTTSTSRS